MTITITVISLTTLTSNWSNQTFRHLMEIRSTNSWNAWQGRVHLSRSAKGPEWFVWMEGNIQGESPRTETDELQLKQDDQHQSSDAREHASSAYTAVFAHNVRTWNKWGLHFVFTDHFLPVQGKVLESRWSQTPEFVHLEMRDDCWYISSVFM